MSSTQRPRILILYGSETGCAEDVAERLGRQALKRRFTTRVRPMNDYAESDFDKDNIVLFIPATTGQGEEPRNMKLFWKYLLRRTLPADLLSHLSYAVFGLGDSGYAKFNYPGKKLHKRLAQLGATALIPRGDGDDQHYLGLDGALHPWASALWTTLESAYPLPEGMTMFAEESLLPSSYDIQLAPSATPLELRTWLDEGEERVVCEENVRITDPTHFQDARHLSFRIPPNTLTYAAGDVMNIRPENLPADVENLLELLGYADIADTPLIITPRSSDMLVHAWTQQPQTLRHLFTHHFDAFSTPRNSFFEWLSHFVEDEEHREKLQEFVSPAGQDDLQAYCRRMRRTTVEVLRDFCPFSIPIKYLPDVFPRLRPRSFSIASAPTEEGKIELGVGIIWYKTKMSTPRVGVCTKWLATMEKGYPVISSISRGSMRLPSDPSTPLILIGPGLGVVPMRSFLQERISHGAYNNILFFGCRYKEKDYHYRKEMEEWESQGHLQLFTAFSRDQKPRVYVQDLIIQQGNLLWEAIHEQDARVLLSGNANRMPDDVADALCQVISAEGRMSPEDARAYFADMEKYGQFQQECWY